MDNVKSILITGASSGLGKALALGYAKPGVDLFLTGRNQKRLEDVVVLCRNQGAHVVEKVIDIAQADGLKGWIEQCDASVPIDLVIANAGISNAGKAVSLETSQLIFDTNIQGVLNTIHPIIPLMKKRKQGHIAIMSSLAGFVGMARAPAYCASKAAVRVYGEALAGQLCDDGISVSVICPGFVKTPLTDANEFTMPFLINADRAVTIIMKKLSQKKRLIAFPMKMYLIVRLLSFFQCYRIFSKP